MKACAPIVKPNSIWGAVKARDVEFNQAAEWAKLCWDVLAGQGQRIIKEGKALETPAENIAELTAQAQAFADKQLPALKAMGVE